MKKRLHVMEKRAKLAEEIKRRERINYLSPFPVYDTDIINDLKKLLMITKKENYNNVPVTYCKTCLSLHIKDVTFPRSDNDENDEEKQPDAKVGYCIECGNTDFAEAPISEWEEIYEEKYDEKFLKEDV